MKRLLAIFAVFTVLISSVCGASYKAYAEMLEGETGIDTVEALYFEDAPTIDGYISEEEWGRATVKLQHDWCATKDDSEPHYNSFFYWRKGTLSENPMEAEIWLRWDENNYYVGVKVKDYDGHSLLNNKSETWNGDSIQFRVDSEGPNAAMGGEDYDPYYGTPWSDADVVPDIVAGYTEVADGYFECYDNSNKIGLTSALAPVFGAVQLAVAPSEQYRDDGIGYHNDSIAGYTTYEMAIPWKYIFENHLVPDYYLLTEEEAAPYVLEYAEYDFKRCPKGGIGYELGMSLTVFNAEKNSSIWKSFMSWGSGVTQVQKDEAHQTCAGSNRVVLTGEKVMAGDYNVYDPSVLESEPAEKTFDTVFYDYLAGDIDCRTPVESYEELMALTYDDESYMDFWGSAELYQGSIINVSGTHGNVLNYDRMIETKIDEYGEIRYAGVDAIDQFYIDTALTQDSSVALRYPLSYTFDFDVMYTGNDMVQKGKDSNLGLWFGGSNNVSYYCGYNFEYNAFVISNDMGEGEILYAALYELEAFEWYNWKFQFDNESCTLRFYVNNKLIFDVTDKYLSYTNSSTIEDGSMLHMWFRNTQMKMDNVRIYNFYDYEAGSIGGEYNVTGKVTTFEGDGAVEISLYDIYSGEIVQSLSCEARVSDYKFEDVAVGSYLLMFEKYKHVSDFVFVSVEASDVKVDDITLYLLGDVDLDGVVAGVDILALMAAVKNDEYVSTYYDIDGDFMLSASDVMLLNQIIKGTYDYGYEDEVEKPVTFSLPVLVKSQYILATDISFEVTLDVEKMELGGIDGLDISDYEITQSDDDTYVIKILNINKVHSMSVGSTLFELLINVTEDTTVDDLKNGVKVVDKYKIAAN